VELRWPLEADAEGLALSVDGKLLAAADGTRIVLLDVVSSASAVLAGHTEPLLALAWGRTLETWAPGGGGGGARLLASASADQTARLWACDPGGGGGECLHVLPEQPDYVRGCDPAHPQRGPLNREGAALTRRDACAGLAFDAGHLLTAAGAAITLWGPSADDDWAAGPPRRLARLAGHSNDVRKLVLLPDDDGGGAGSGGAGGGGSGGGGSEGGGVARVLSCADDGTARVWSLGNALREPAAAGHSDSVTACAWATGADGELVVISTDRSGFIQCQPAGCPAGSLPLWRERPPPIDPSCRAIVALAVLDGGGGSRVDTVILTENDSNVSKITV
jgi:hypothetical protein